MGKTFDGCFNVFAWINNTFWGTLFIVAGVYAMFWERNFAFGVLGLGIGIYFFWTKSWTRKTVAVIAGEDPDESDAPAAAPIAAVAPPGSVSQHKMVIKRVLVFASIMCLYLGSRGLNVDEESIGASAIVYGALALACFFVFARTTVHRATEDALPALPWGAMFVAVLSAAFSPNARRVSFTTQEAAATSTDEEATAVVAGLSGRTKILLIVALAGVVVIVGGMKLTGAVRAAWDHKLEGDYARLEADAQAEHEALEAETDSGGGSAAGSASGESDDYEEAAAGTADPSSDGEITTNASPMSTEAARAVIGDASKLEDLLSMYRGTGLYEIEVYYSGRVIDAGHELVFNDGEELVWAIPFDKVQGGFYINDQECSEQEFYEMVVSGHVMPGTVGFDQNQLWSVNVSTE